MVVQHGATSPEDSWSNFQWHDYLPFDEMTSHMSAARAFFCHAGVGSVMAALSGGTVPIVIPREAALGEHVDDHQIQLAKKLCQRDQAICVPDGDVLKLAERADALRGGTYAPNPELLAAVKAAAA